MISVSTGFLRYSCGKTVNKFQSQSSWIWISESEVESFVVECWTILMHVFPKDVLFFLRNAWESWSINYLGIRIPPWKNQQFANEFLKNFSPTLGSLSCALQEKPKVSVHLFSWEQLVLLENEKYNTQEVSGLVLWMFCAHPIWTPTFRNSAFFVSRDENWKRAGPKQFFIFGQCVAHRNNLTWEQNKTDDRIDFRFNGSAYRKFSVAIFLMLDRITM